MPLAAVWSAAVWGLDAVPVAVEVDIAPGLPEFTIVGLPDKAVQESRKRVHAAIINCGYDFPRGKVTVNLAPADLKKIGPAYDLPIATAVMIASGLTPVADLKDTLIVGELALDGAVRPISGMLPIALGLSDRRFSRAIVPSANGAEAALVERLKVVPVAQLNELVEHLTGQRTLKPLQGGFERSDAMYDFDFAYIAGQEQIKRGLEVAAAGGHNVLLSGPPGGGKTLLARALPSILPTMTEEETLEVSKIYSIAGFLHGDQPLVTQRPFRNPHHTASTISLVGGGAFPRPGEISLAHRGVLFLDEMPEFPRSVLESLRQPLEDGEISVSRAAGNVAFPARFMLLGTANPCPCGYLTDPTHTCRCTTGQILAYNKKMSGPLLDRVDLYLEVPKVPFDKLSDEVVAELSRRVRERVELARQRQLRRQDKTNAELNIAELRTHASLSPVLRQLLEQSATTLNLTARGFHRVIKVARTIADLGQEPEITQDAILEAIQYHQKERAY